MGHHFIAGERVASLEVKSAASIEIEAERLSIASVSRAENVPVVCVKG